MSVWTTVSGTAVINKDKHFSLRKSVEDKFGDEIVFDKWDQSSENPLFYVYSFEFRCTRDGWDLERDLYSWLREVPWKWKDINAELRFL